MGYEIRKTNGGWAVIRTMVVEIRPDKKEAKECASALERGELLSASVSFDSIARQSGRYTTYAVIPSSLVQNLGILPGDSVYLSLNMAIDEVENND